MHSRTERMQGLQKIYQAVCDVSREFSMTRVLATLESGISAQEFDHIYFREAEKVDTIRFLAWSTLAMSPMTWIFSTRQ